MNAYLQIMALALFCLSVGGLIGYVAGNTAPTARAYRHGARDAYAQLAMQARDGIAHRQAIADDARAHAASILTD